MRLVLLALMVVGCGHPGGTGVTSGDDEGVPVDAAGDGSGSGLGSNNGSGNGNGSGSGSGNGGGGGGGSNSDDVETGCTAPATPSVTLAVTSNTLGPGLVFRAGDQILAKPVIDEAHYWLRWTGSGWNSELIPWPANLPTIHNHYIARVVQLATTRALIVTDDHWLMTYDGTTMSPAIALPSAVGPHVWGYSQDAAGAYHVFWGAKEWTSKPDGTWNPPAPIPFPLLGSEDDVTGAAAIMRSGRVVALYLDTNYNSPARHAHLLSRPANGAWTDSVDITPTWAVNAENPQLYAPPGGGIAINVTGASTYYKVPALWRSTDGGTLGDYETLSNGVMLSFTGECLDSLVINGTSSTSYALYERQGTSWVTFAGHESSSVPRPSEVAVAALPNGKTFWAIGKYLGTDYLVSP